MAQRFPPGITALARKHRLGTPLKRYNQLGMILLISPVPILFLGVDLFTILQSLLTNPSHFSLAAVALAQVVFLGFAGYGIYHMWIQYSTYFYLCTEGFLEIKRGRPPTVKHALRWDYVRSTRVSQRINWFVTDKQGREFRINCAAVFDRCKDAAARN